jgi:Protein of unknown function (DUF1116)
MTDSTPPETASTVFASAAPGNAELKSQPPEASCEKLTQPAIFAPDLPIAACTLALGRAGRAGPSMVTAMARNGVNFGIQVSRLDSQAVNDKA